MSLLMNENIFKLIVSAKIRFNVLFTAQKITFSTKDFFSKCEQIFSFLSEFLICGLKP